METLRIGAGAQTREDGATLDLVVIVALALAVRLVLLPYASQETSDHTYRIFIAWRWAENPTLLLHGMWGPLHYFLVGPVVRLFNDPVVAPVLLHVVVGSLVPAVLYLFTAREFGERNAALAAGVAFAFYPIAIRTSVQVLAQPWFYLCVALTLLALSRARDPSGDWRHAAAAGLVAALGTMLRAEGWLLIPFLALTLWPRIVPMAVFVAVAIVGPMSSMVANGLHYGDPLFSLNQSAELMLGDVGAAQLSLMDRIEQSAKLVVRLVGGLTPVLAVFAVLGAVSCLLRRSRQAVWLLPLGGLGILMFVAAARGSLNPKAIFTGTFGLLLIPYLAAFLTSPQIRRLGTVGRAGIHAVLFGSMTSLVVVGAARAIPELRNGNRLIAAIPAVAPLPTFSGTATLDRILPEIRAQPKGDGEALVVDALGNPATFYLGLQSLYHPDRIFIAPGQPFRDLDSHLSLDRPRSSGGAETIWDASPPGFDGFLFRHCSGVLVLQPGSRFSAWLDYRAPHLASLRGVDLRLEELIRAPWPLPADARLRAAGVPDGAPGDIVVFRYSVTNCRAGAEARHSTGSARAHAGRVAADADRGGPEPGHLSAASQDPFAPRLP